MKKKMMKAAAYACSAAMVLTGCFAPAAFADEAEAAGEEDHVIKVGAVCAMTGGSAVYGTGAQNAIDMAVDEINNSDSEYKIEIVNGGKVADDAKDAKQAVNAYNLLKSEDPEAVVGSFFSAVTIPMAQLAAKDDMLLLATGATNVAVTQYGPTIFRNCFIDPFQGKMAAQFAQEQGYKTAAVIYAKDDDYSNGLKDAFIESAADAGIDVVYTGECTTTDTDFTAQATEVVAAEPDFVFYPCFLDTVPLLVQQVRDAGFEGAIMGGDGWDGADTSGLEDYFTNCYFTNHYSSEDTAPAVQDFVKKYTDTYGDDTLNACAALYYDAMYMLVQAAEDGGGSDTASLVKGMTGMHFSGVGGNIYLDENGDAIKPVVVNTYEDGKIKWLETIQPEGGEASTEAETEG